MVKYFLSFFAFLLVCTTVFAQITESDSITAPQGASAFNLKSRKAYRSIEIIQNGGSHLYTGTQLNDFLKYGYASVDVRYTWQTTEEDLWARESHFPKFGVGIYTGFLGDPKTFGNPSAIYGFMNHNLFRVSKTQHADMSLAVGLTYDLAPYNPETNPMNDAIGSRVTVFFDLKTGLVYRMTRELDLLYGISLSHFSNGRTVVPNLGLNMLGFYIGTRYNFNRDQRKLNRDPYTTEVLPARYKKPSKYHAPYLRKRNSISLYGAVGTVQNYDDEVADISTLSTRYYPTSVALDYEYSWNGVYGFNIGFDYFNDPSLAGIYPDLKKFSLFAIHAGYDFNIWRFTTKIQVGTYLSDNYGKQRIFLRPALRYNFSNHFFAQIGLKTRKGAAADWVEWGIGFRPLLW